MNTRLLRCCRIVSQPAAPVSVICLWAIIILLCAAGMAPGQTTNDPLMTPAEKLTSIGC